MSGQPDDLDHLGHWAALARLAPVADLTRARPGQDQVLVPANRDEQAPLNCLT
jgi:hypothetical protein